MPCYEVLHDQSAGTAAAEDDPSFEVLTSSDPAVKLKKPLQGWPTDDL
jgi:hypothetical protein